MKLDEFKKCIKELEGKKIGVISHRHQDIDAIVSCYLIKYLIEKEGGTATILVYEGLNYDAEKLSENYNIRYKKVESGKELEEFDDLIVVDTQSIEQLDIVKNKKVFAVIDHHEKSATLINAKHYFIDKKSVANAQNILQLSGMDSFGEREKELISIAIISDTFRFKRFDKKSAKIFYEILEEISTDYEELLKHAFPERDKNQKIAIMNAIKRSEYIESGNYLIGYTESNESSGEIASLLTSFCDIAIVFKERNDGRTSMSLRCNDFFPFELNKIAERVAQKVGGAGGGHKKAAGALLSKTLKECKLEVIEIIRNLLKGKIN